MNFVAQNETTTYVAKFQQSTTPRAKSVTVRKLGKEKGGEELELPETIDALLTQGI